MNSHRARTTRWASLCVALVMTLGGLAALAAPAQAWDGWIDVDNGVLYDTCRDHTYRYDLDVEDGYGDVSMDVSAYGPDGTVAASDYVFDEGTSGRGEFLFCGYEMAGWYEIEAEVTACNEDYDCYDFTVWGTFHLRKPQTRTSFVVSPRKPRYNRVVKFVVRTRDERPRGYFSTDGAQVVLQVKRRGTWQRVRASKTYAWDGKAVLRYRWNVRGRQRVRAVTLATSSRQSSASRPITIRTR